MTPHRIVEAAKAVTKSNSVRNELDNLQWAPEYAEPGYSAPKRGGIFFANWNGMDGDDTMSRLSDALERYGCEIEWSDEWTTCDGCNKAVRTIPDSYGWLPSYAYAEGEILCHECIKDDPEAYLYTLEGKADSALTLDIDPAEHGYTLLEDGFEAGFHPGQTANPHEIAKRLRAEGITRFLFRVDSVGQFDTFFSVYVPQDESDGAE